MKNHSLSQKMSWCDWTFKRNALTLRNWTTIRESGGFEWDIHRTTIVLQRSVWALSGESPGPAGPGIYWAASSSDCNSVFLTGAFPLEDSV